VFKPNNKSSVISSDTANRRFSELSSLSCQCPLSRWAHTYLVFICDSLTLRVSKSYQGMLTWCTLFQKALLETSEGAAKLLDPLRAAKNYWWSVAHIWKEVMTVVSVWPLPLFSRSIKGVREPGCSRHLQVLDTAGVLLYGENTALGRFRPQRHATMACGLRGWEYFLGYQNSVYRVWALSLAGISSAEIKQSQGKLEFSNTFVLLTSQYWVH